MSGGRPGRPSMRALVLRRWPEAFCVRSARGLYLVVKSAEHLAHHSLLASGPTEKVAWSRAARAESENQS